MQNRLFITILMVFTMMAHAQNNYFTKSSVSVYGVVPYQMKPTAFSAIVTLNLTDAQYAGLAYTSVQEMKDDFIQKLVQKGIDTKQITEDEIDYITIGKAGNGTSLLFNSNDEQSFKRFLNTSMPGSYVSNIRFKRSLLNKTAAQIEKEAFDDAEMKAKQLANQIGRKIGKIIRIDAPVLLTESQWAYYALDDLYQLYITYELME